MIFGEICNFCVARKSDWGRSSEVDPPFYRFEEVYFPSMQALEACAASEGGKEALAHAVKISTGGAPIFLVAEEETFTLAQTRNA